ncbi:MAG: hypothetical protein ACP5NS_00710 [Candidatus Pacearchaeota archaeon]
MRVWWLFVVGLLVFPFVSAGIFIEPLNPIYNSGDLLTTDTNVVTPVASSGHYTAELVCPPNLTIPIFNQFIYLNPNTEKHFEIATQINSPALKNSIQSCFMRANYNGETVSSNSFRISKLVNLDTELAFDELKPGATVSIDGVAFKESELPFNGYVELFLPSLNLYKSGTIQNGKLNISALLPTNAKSGIHNATLIVHDSDSIGGQLNNGTQSYTLKVLQVLSTVEIVAENENIKPGEEFVFVVDARDQAGDPMAGQVSIVISDPSGLPFIKKVVKQGEEQRIAFSLNNTAGYWSVEATVSAITKRKLFYLAELPKIQTSLINDTLIVTNIGNAPYDGPLEITIGSQVEVKQLSLKVGETEKFTLHAPDGSYSISVLGEEERESLGTTFLTGKAIQVTDLKDDFLNTISDPLIWWLAAILFVMIVILVQVKMRLQRSPPTPGSQSIGSWAAVRPVSEPTPIQTRTEIKPTESPRQSQSVSHSLSQRPSNSTQSAQFGRDQPRPQLAAPPGANPFAQVHEGIREKAVVIAVKAVGGTSPYVMQTLNNALSLAQETGAKIYVDGEFKVVLFSPKLTRSYDNETLAVNAARRMESLFLEHNRLYNERISFGIGISDGEIISEIEGGKFHFTSVGNVISSAKRIAQSAPMKLLLSDPIRKKVMSTIKTEQSGATGYWEVTRVVDRSSGTDFMRRFNERNK